MSTCSGSPGCRRVLTKLAPRGGHGSGFTLVELLVVIAIIGILVALLLPAIQSAREAARRGKCQSNLKNIALALENYHSAKKRYPPGFVSTGPQAIEAWAWSTFALPYLEEQSIYDRMNPSETYIEPVLATRTGKRNLADMLAAAGNNLASPELVPLQTPLPIFRCPTDNTPDLIPEFTGIKAAKSPCAKGRPFASDDWERTFKHDNAAAPDNFRPSTSNYVGSKGFINGPCNTKVASPWTPDQARCNNNGIFFGNSQISTKHITDGTSKVFLVGERDKFCLAATWIGVRNPFGPDSWSSNWAMGHVGYKLNFACTGDHDTCTEGFSSAHAGGAYFAYCDASVHFISDEISFENLGQKVDCYYTPPSHSQGCYAVNGSGTPIGVYQRLAWRNDGLPAEEY